jgi:hypothetical protein
MFMTDFLIPTIKRYGHGWSRLGNRSEHIHRGLARGVGTWLILVQGVVLAVAYAVDQVMSKCDPFPVQNAGLHLCCTTLSAESPEIDLHEMLPLS